MERAYTVRGAWPFPLDMLRHDCARAATPADQLLIDRMSGDVSDDEFGLTEVSINLIMEAGEPIKARPGGRYLPNGKRWESFGWEVTNVPEIDQDRALDALMKSEAALRESALAKLTPEERNALGLA